MCTTFSCIDVVYKSNNLFIKLIVVLDCNLYRDWISCTILFSSTFTFKRNRIGKNCLILVQVLHIRRESSICMERLSLLFSATLIGDSDGDSFIEIAEFSESFTESIVIKRVWLHDSKVWSKAYNSTCTVCVSDNLD